jgi:hypothetical protein
LIYIYIYAFFSSSLLALAVTAAVFLSPAGGALWPLQNVANAFVAVTVARVVQLPSLPLALSALGGLILYDFIAVSGTQQFTDGGLSIMEAVARAKITPTTIQQVHDSAHAAINAIAASGGTLTVVESFKEGLSHWISSLFSSPWKPGLLEISVGGKVSDVLGLADVIFPTILASWALRFDDSIAVSVASDSTENNNKKGERKLFGAALGGFVLGCIMCEVFQTGQGQPALLFLVPSMVLSITVVGKLNNRLQEMWNFKSPNF